MDMWKTINRENAPSITARKLGKVNFVIRDELDARFREEVFKRKGMKKGNLTEALEEALELWMDTAEEKRGFAIKDKNAPSNAFAGSMEWLTLTELRAKLTGTPTKHVLAVWDQGEMK